MVRVYRATSGDYATGREQLDSARDSAYRLRYIAMRGDVIFHSNIAEHSDFTLPRAANSEDLRQGRNLIIFLLS